MSEKKKKMGSEASSSSSSHSNSNSSGDSVVDDVGQCRSSCDYCKSGGRTSISHRLWARSLTVDDYQALLDRGWRRAGCLLYKPEMETTCCPSYTIRLKSTDFVPSKEQRRVLKRMQRFLDGTLDKSSDDLKDSSGDSQPGNLEEKYKTEPLIPHMESQIDKAVHVCIGGGDLSSDFQFPRASVKKVAPAKRKLSTQGSEDLLFTSSISFQIAATLRRQRKDVEHEKSSELGAGERGQAADTPKVIAEKLGSHLNSLAESLGLLVRACNGHINFYSSERRVAVVSNQNESKQSSSRSCSKESFSSTAHENPELKRRTFEAHLKRASFDPEEYSLYRRYQISVHNDSPDEVAESSYRRFLVDTPLIFVPPSSGDLTVPPCGFGSFHQQYLIDGRLVAVGVIDILPKCLSSKYLFWDPDFAFLSLGKYSSLQEIRWVAQNQVHCPSLQYYYLGYYIHSCSKMRYKAAYRPSELLCLLRYQWVPFDVAKPLLDRKRYIVLSDFATQNGEPLPLSTLENYEEETDEQRFHGSNDIFVGEDEDEEMDEFNYEDSDDELVVESSDIKLPKAED
ncbi:arginyl-tRNA--protein transferase 1-like [Lycium barbarum]|uniref:arginyl-tRNA--protein transferase 1-like n=1 Tax=Lycium barbarum TaxID=112863 RepID=UPI00293E25EB|nr:arginyl-tRNA--protein transferase 1-like [Lycium barbarum]XP_060217951.1 arginyl-tRNA--protein transferase 1-like [Lycium barbarum]XP_060217952.1 arginyl-tRNA--protein transferase 1-like [Lycium barbarum]XP_060217953.1 arginyl-tRNA--protein transferase 1-like [Lycium barbarum]XP_060217954.1 arginyl-tRNA--protein transferase 1-like [Lycium barbarum]XP_060217956.1 arginyl-tRNA--protein transferase 1-like [Lycium barbarum]